MADTKSGDIETFPQEDPSAPAYKAPSNVDAVDDGVAPKKSITTRILHSFRRREDTFTLNALGQQVLDPEKEGDSTTIHSRDTSRLKRKLKGRHMQMIAIGGAIGTGISHPAESPHLTLLGLFVGSGSTLATGGPLALMIGFGLVGIMLFFVIHALGELAVTFPIEGRSSFGCFLQ